MFQNNMDLSHTKKVAIQMERQILVRNPQFRSQQDKMTKEEKFDLTNNSDNETNEYGHFLSKKIKIDQTTEENETSISLNYLQIMEAQTSSNGKEIQTAQLGSTENSVLIEDIRDHKNGWLTCYSQHNKLYHVQSGLDGHFKVDMCFRNVQDYENGIYFIRSVLIKKNQRYKDYPVDKVCDKHASKNKHMNKQPIQAALTTSNQEYVYTESGFRPSILHWCKKPDGQQIIKKTINLTFPCNDTCSNTSFDNQIKTTEASRDLILVQTLECASQGKILILARHIINIWPKSVVCKRDLAKTERRKPKGSLAQISKKGNQPLKKDNDNYNHCILSLNKIHFYLQNNAISREDLTTIATKLEHIKTEVKKYTH